MSSAHFRHPSRQQHCRLSIGYRCRQENELLSIAVKFRESKRELRENVRHRLAGWIREVHRSMQKSAAQVAVFGERMGALRRRLDLLRQIHDAPTVYAAGRALNP